MTADTATHSVREAVGVFDDEVSLQQAALELMESGFDRASLGLLDGESAIGEKLGHMYDRAAEVEDDPSVPTTAFVQSESIGAAEGAALGTLIYPGADRDRRRGRNQRCAGRGGGGGGLCRGRGRATRPTTSTSTASPADMTGCIGHTTRAPSTWQRKKARWTE